MSFMEILYMPIPLTLTFSAPIIITSIGGLFSERSGVVNIGLEGIMIVGAFSAATTTVLLEPTLGNYAPWLALIIAMIIGGLFSLIHAFVSVNWRADQVVAGTALNMLALAVTVYLTQVIFGAQRTPAFMYGIRKTSVPLLSDIPVVGDMFFKDVPYTSYLAILIVIIAAVVIYKTAFGLRLRAVGEHPGAADSMGVNVYKMRYLGVLISGICAGLGGGILVLTSDIQFTGSTIAGQGFIALAALIFGQWKPLGVLGASLFFGAATAFSFVAPSISFLSKLPNVVFYILPYVLTIIALVIFAGKSVGPKAAGVPYDKSTR